MLRFSEEALRNLNSAQHDVDATPCASLANDSPRELEGVVFLMCLEPGPADASTPPIEAMLNTVVEALQPSPGILHVELAFPDTGSIDGFATYIGATANFTKHFGGQRSFYFGAHASRWRAIPIVARNAAARLRDECSKHVGTTYSLARYACSVPPLRALAAALPDRVQSSAHCATLSARLLHRALPDVGLAHSSAWYGPASLFLEVDSLERRRDAAIQLSASAQHVFAAGEEDATDAALRALVGGDDDDVCGLEAGSVASALRALAVRAVDTDLDDVARRIAQKQLATGLLRCAVNR